MSITDTIRGDAWGNPNLYFAVGLLSVLKALAVRNDSKRFRRELFDGVLFIGTGVLLRRLSRRRPAGPSDAAERLRAFVTPEEPTLRERARHRLPSEREVPQSLRRQVRRRLS